MKSRPADDRDEEIARLRSDVVQSLAGHSYPTLTLGVYAHVGLFDQTTAPDALPELTPSAPIIEPATLTARGQADP
jgi:hypothetical protein